MESCKDEDISLKKCFDCPHVIFCYSKKDIDTFNKSHKPVKNEKISLKNVRRN